jgi:Phage integrase family
MRALRRLQREGEASQFVFVSERGAPFTTAGFARMLQRAAMATSLTLKVHPHMLRHACGFALANSGHDTRALQAYLGHRNIQHTVRYTELAPNRFKHFWRDWGEGASLCGSSGFPILQHSKMPLVRVIALRAIWQSKLLKLLRRGTTPGTTTQSHIRGDFLQACERPRIGGVLQRAGGEQDAAIRTARNAPMRIEEHIDANE